MDWHYIAAGVAGVLGIVSVIPYIRDMLRGTTRPNLVTWGLWCLTQGIFVAAQFASGASLSIVLPLVGFVAVFCVVFLGFFGYGYKKHSLFDIVCLCLALGAIILWQLTSDPYIALWLSVAADLLATTPTFVKAYRDPHSETFSAYFWAALAAIAAGLATSIYNLPNLLWPLYTLLGNTFIMGLIFFGTRHPKKHKKRG